MFVVQTRKKLLNKSLGIRKTKVLLYGQNRVTPGISEIFLILL